MKREYIVFKDKSYDEKSMKFVPNVVKTFKHKPEAKAFINDPKNVRRYGQLYLFDPSEQDSIVTEAANGK